MRHSTHLLLALVSAAGGSSALGQDSVSAGSGLPGDAVIVYAAGANPALNEQSNAYVVDLAGIASSWGGAYRVGPIAKASHGGSAGGGRFTHFIAPTVASNRFASGAFPRPTYDAWRAPGQGVNALQNSTPTDDGSGKYGPRSTAGLTGTHLAVAFMEFGAGPNTVFGDGDDEQSVIVALAGFEPAEPSRWYVTRIAAAANKLVAGGATGTSSLGVGGIDPLGGAHLIADGFGMTSASAIPDKRLIRVAAGSRGTGVNHLSTSGATDAPATTTALSNQVVQSAPTMIPATASGGAGRPVMLGMDFAGVYLYESSPGSLVGSTAWTGSGGGDPPGSIRAPRGPLSVSADGFARHNTSGASVATVAVLSGLLDAGSRTRTINLWGAGPTGAITGTSRLDLPTAPGSLTDPLDGFNPAAIFGPLADAEFTNFASQVSFRGPAGPVALSVLPGGDLLVAATVAFTGDAAASPQSLDNAIAVARVSAATGAASWSIAAHSGDVLGAAGGLSKVILGDFGADGIPGTADAGEGDGAVDRGPNAWIGRIARADEGPAGHANGPSISSPAMDRLGNLYFLASAAYKAPGAPGATRHSVSLLRANYDPATGGYELERLLDIGDTILGPNSTLPYRVAFMSAADGDSVDSGAVFASSIVQDFAPGVDPLGLGYADPRSLGALVVRATILYDRNGDGQFIDPTTPGHAASPDQAYAAAILITPGAPTARDPRDFNGDGAVDPDDLGDFINAYFAVPPDPRADFNRDGTIDPDDLGDYINAFFG